MRGNTAEPRMTDTVAFTLSPDGRATTWSLAVREAFGYASHEFVGRPFTELFAPADDVEPDRVLAAAQAEGHAVLAGWRVGKSGRRSLVAGAVSLLLGADGRPAGFVVAMRATADAEAVAAAPAVPPESATDLVAEAMWRLPESFYVLDEHLRFVYLNQACERMWGLGPAEVLGRHLADVFPEVRDTEFLLRHVEAVAGGEPLRFETFSPVRGRTVEVLLQPVGAGTAALVRDPYEDSVASDQQRPGVPPSALEVAVHRFTPHDGALAPVGAQADVFGLREGERLASHEQKLALVLPVDRKAYDRTVSEAARRGEPWQAQYRVRRPRDGATAWLAEHATLDDAGGESAYVVMTWDVTVVRRVEEQLRAGNRRLRRELSENRHLYEVMTRAAEAEDARAGVEMLLAAAIEVTGGLRGGVWLLDEGEGKLRVFAQVGFKGAFLSEFGVLPVDPAVLDPASTGLAWTELPADQVAALAEDGEDAAHVRALCLSLLSGTGAALGKMCVHLDGEAQPSARDFYALKMLALQAAALLDRRLMEERSGELLRRLEEHARVAGDALLESELMFRRAFELGPVAAVITTRDEDRFLEVNDWYLKLTGYERDEVVGRTARELGMWSSPDDRQKLDAALRAGGKFRELQLRLRTKDGHVRDILLSGEEVSYAGQRCMLKMFNDVTEQHRSQEELMAAIREVMSDAEWFSKSVVQRLAQIRHGEPGTLEDLDLTPREREVLELVAAGLGDEEVADRLGISQRTARNHLTNTYGKIGARNRSEAIVWARERGLVSRVT